MTNALIINDIAIAREGKTIVDGVSLTVPAGEVHALMGPNGSGKSSLANTLMGHPKYEQLRGTITLNGDDITGLTPDEKSRKGLFLSMQHPPEIAGVSLSNFLRTAVNAHRETPLGVVEFRKRLQEAMTELGMDPALSARSLNEGFSGGEKKRAEALQLMMLVPKYAILDETDSGLDVDALKAVTHGIELARAQGMGILVITHYTRILAYLKPNAVHVMANGKIVTDGGPDLADRIEKDGYADIIA